MFSKIEDDIKNFKNGRRPQKFQKWKTTLIVNGRQKRKEKLFLISLKFRGDPFLGLAQLSKIFVSFNIQKKKPGWQQKHHTKMNHYLMFQIDPNIEKAQ